jgi:hypothetical protein
MGAAARFKGFWMGPRTQSTLLPLLFLGAPILYDWQGTRLFYSETVTFQHPCQRNNSPLMTRPHASNDID